MNPDVVRLTDVRKTYGGRRNSVTALDGVTIGFPRATFTAVMGPSGSGKSTFLHCAAGLDRPTSGSVLLDDQELAKLSEVELTKLRRDRVGFVFQAFNLLPAFSVQENVTLPFGALPRTPSTACWRRSGCPTGANTCPASCPAASSSGWRSPARWSPGPP
jgi:putative ABC transport system ATP-binding protein